MSYCVSSWAGMMLHIVGAQLLTKRTSAYKVNHSQPVCSFLLFLCWEVMALYSAAGEIFECSWLFPRSRNTPLVLVSPLPVFSALCFIVQCWVCSRPGRDLLVLLLYPAAFPLVTRPASLLFECLPVPLLPELSSQR